jgi:hypothetical protein
MAGRGASYRGRTLQEEEAGEDSVLQESLEHLHVGIDPPGIFHGHGAQVARHT